MLFITRKNNRMKNPFSDISRFRSRFSSQKVTLLWYQLYRRVFLVFFAAVLVAGAWYWYYSLYQYSWSERTKKAFLDSYVQETDFKEASFKKAVSASLEKRKQHETGVSLEHDFFRLDTIPEKK